MHTRTRVCRHVQGHNYYYYNFLPVPCRLQFCRNCRCPQSKPRVVVITDSRVYNVNNNNVYVLSTCSSVLHTYHIPWLHHTLTWLGHTLVIAEERTVSVHTHTIHSCLRLPILCCYYLFRVYIIRQQQCRKPKCKSSVMQRPKNMVVAVGRGSPEKNIIPIDSSARKRLQMRESSVSAHRYPCTYIIYYKISYNMNAQYYNYSSVALLCIVQFIMHRYYYTYII